MTHLLEILPYPLMPPQYSFFYGNFRTPTTPVHKTRQKQDSFEETYLCCRDQLVSLTSLSSHQHEAKWFANEYGLIHLCFDVFYPAHLAITPLVRATALYESLGQPYTTRGRISRQTAAWIWGYLAYIPPILHIDFDRTLRLNVTRARQRNIETHQVRVIAYDYIQLGRLRVTTPLRTAIDMLLFDGQKETDQLIEAILLDTTNDCSIGRIYETLDMMTYVRHKSQALERLNTIMLKHPHLR